jgi:hypothetical protein
MRSAALLVLLAALSGCSESRRASVTPSSEITDEYLDAVDDLLSHSYAYRRVKREAKHPRFYIDSKENDYWETAIGDDDVEVDDGVFRFNCWDSLRVYRNGGLKRLDVVNDIWLDDRAPDNWRE